LGDGVDSHWSATLVALVTLNSFAVPFEALELIPEFPELAVAEALDAEAFAFELEPS
jgi:hypothetical protein